MPSAWRDLPRRVPPSTSVRRGAIITGARWRPADELPGAVPRRARRGHPRADRGVRRQGGGRELVRRAMAAAAPAGGDDGDPDGRRLRGVRADAGGGGLTGPRWAPPPAAGLP